MFSRGKLIDYCRYRKIPLIKIIIENNDQGTMAKEIRLPQLGDTMEEGTIVCCRVNSGDHVKNGDVLFDIETDKATLELESSTDGFVKQIMAKVGQTYRVGTPLLILGQKDEKLSKEFVQSLTIAGPITSPAPVKSEVQEEEAPATISVPAVAGEINLGMTIPVSRLQRITAQKMLRSKQEIPCFYLTVRADVTELVAYRSKLNEASDTKIAYNDFIIKAVAMGLERFPIMTGQLDGDTIKLAGAIGVGLAISVEDGLAAPIVKDADKKTLVEIARYTKLLAERTQNNQLTLEDLEGGCITVSNLGPFGIDFFIPIVVPGQCSILGIGQIKEVCVPDVDSTPDNGIRGQASTPQDSKINIRKVMNMTLSVDHKVANGAYAAQFLDFVKKLLEDPANFK
jgi:pyruvate dehydrogenase E2 component (dihydrolipoamide acetyltransferase)